MRVMLTRYGYVRVRLVVHGFEPGIGRMTSSTGGGRNGKHLDGNGEAVPAADGARGEGLGPEIAEEDDRRGVLRHGGGGVGRRDGPLHGMPAMRLCAVRSSHADRSSHAGATLCISRGGLREGGHRNGADHDEQEAEGSLAG